MGLSSKTFMLSESWSKNNYVGTRYRKVTQAAFRNNSVLKLSDHHRQGGSHNELPHTASF